MLPAPRCSVVVRHLAEDNISVCLGVKIQHSERGQDSRYLDDGTGQTKPPHGPGARCNYLLLLIWRVSPGTGPPRVSSCLPWKKSEPHLHQRQLSQKLIMLTEEMKLWHGLVIAVLSLFLQICLLMALNYLLSRNIDESNTSSDSSVSSVSLNNPATLPSTFQAIKDVNYTPVVFSAPESVLDYENIKEATDYVNVNPEKPKPKIWTSVNASFVDPVEYTQVAV
ncbi:Hypothetical predicted protein [Marmota monax]|uniref:Regulator of hemoglobinization and erythroid cell expansion protein n=1 Tax=Marmota monax TaxID=9995 RepID=A0A5E4AGI1_MARMO|nr:Hypothetical predicted protein [Marmota monax]